MPSVFQNQNINQEDKPCINAHRVLGLIPTSTDQQYDGKICDCGRIEFYLEGCNCNQSSKMLRSRPNPNFVEQY